METEIKKSPRMAICYKCKQNKKYHAKNLCELCYSIKRNKRKEDKKDFQLI